MKDTRHLIIEKYTPLANALRSHWHGTHVEIIPIVTSRTCTPHDLTHTSIITLINDRIDPLGVPSQTPSRDITRIISRVHVLIVQCIHHLFRIYRIKSFATYIQLLLRHFQLSPSNRFHN
jgi:hypothetical protein